MVRIGEIESKERTEREKRKRTVRHVLRMASPPLLLLCGCVLLIGGLWRNAGMVLILCSYVALFFAFSYYDRRNMRGWRGVLLRRLDLRESLAVLGVLVFLALLYFLSYLRSPGGAFEARLLSAVEAGGVISPPGYLPVLFLARLLGGMLWFLGTGTVVLVFSTLLTLSGVLLVYRLTGKALGYYRRGAAGGDDSSGFLPIFVALLYAGSLAQWGQAGTISGLFPSFAGLLILVMFSIVLALERGAVRGEAGQGFVSRGGLLLSLGVLAACDVRLGLIMVVVLLCFFTTAQEKPFFSRRLLLVVSLALGFGLSLVALSATGSEGRFIDYRRFASPLAYWLSPLVGAWTFSSPLDWGAVPKNVAYDLVGIGNELNLLVSWAIIPGIILSRRLLPNYAFSLLGGLVFLLLFAQLGRGFQGYHLLFIGPFCPLLALGLALVLRHLERRLTAAGDKMPSPWRSFFRRRALKVFFSLVLLAVILTPLPGRYETLRERRAGLLVEYGRRLLASLPANAVLLFGDAADYQACVYLQAGEGLSPGVDAVCADWLAERWYLRQVIVKQEGVLFGDIENWQGREIASGILRANRDRPIFICGWRDLSQEADFTMVPNLYSVAVERRGGKFRPDPALADVKVRLPSADPAAARLGRAYYRGWCELGAYYDEKVDDLSLAAACYESALRVNAAGKTARKLLAALYSDRGLLVAAREKYQEIVEKSPGDIEAHLKLAEIHTRRNQLDKAVAEYEKVISLNDKLSMAHYHLGEIYGRKEMDQLAMREYQKAAETDPANVGAHLQLGLLYKKHESYKAATASFQEVLRLDQDNAQAQEELWEIYNIQ